MPTAKEQLLSMMSPQAARLLDQQMRSQQVAQRSQGAGMLSGLVQAYTGMSDAFQGITSGMPMGANQRMAIEAQKQREYQRKVQQDQIASLQSQASVAIDNSSLNEIQKKNLKTILSMDKTGERSAEIIKKYGLPDVTEDSVDQFSSINVGGMGYIYNKSTGEVTTELTGASESSSDPSVNTKSDAKLSADMNGIAKKTIEAITTDKDLDPKTRAILAKEQAKFLKENPEAGVRELASHLGDVLIREVDLADARQAEKARKQTNTDIILTLDTINVIMDNAEDVGEWEYLVAQYLPGTKSKDIKVNLQNLFAKISFDRLQRMRNESKTGGALGNVSNFEIGLLQNSLKALDPEAPSFKDNLKKVKQHYETIMMLYSGNEKQALDYIETNPNYVVTPSGAIYHKAGSGEKPRLVGNLGG